MNPVEKVWGYLVCKLTKSRTPEGMPFHAWDSNNANQLFDLVSYEYGKLMTDEAYLQKLKVCLFVFKVLSMRKVVGLNSD
jgi:hypothetical protein